jgi:hypothetical protein
VRERLDVELDEVQLASDIMVGEGSVLPERSVVHEEIHLDTGQIRCSWINNGAFRISQIGSDDRAAGPVALAQLGGQLIEFVLAAGDEHKIVTVPCEQPGEVRSEPSRGAVTSAVFPVRATEASPVT